MRDDVAFEIRLADALGRLADLAPVMDDDALARQAIISGGSARRVGWLAWLRGGGLDRATVGRSTLRVGYLLVLLALVLAAALAAVALGAFRNDAFRPLGRNGPIAVSFGGNNHEAVAIHLVNPDGSGDHAITATRCPTYSAGGSALASVSYEGPAYLVVQGPDGAPLGKVLLVETPTGSVSYALSPDGTQVAWFKPSPSATSSDRVELWVAPVAGGPGVRAVPGSDASNEFYDSPLWSPDGGRIAFGSYVADSTTGERQRHAISVVAANGTDLRRLTARPGLLDDGMSWSPDGRFLAYVGLPDGPPIPSSTTDAPAVFPPRDVFVIGVDGTGDRPVAVSPASETRPEWSPDGAVLAFETSADGEAHRLTTIHMNGPTPVGLPVLGPETPWFVWSPDGTELLWLEVTSLGSEASRSTLHSIDRDLRGPPTTVRTVDGLIVCPPSWQRLEP